MQRAKIAAVKHGSTLRDLVAEGLRKVPAEESPAKRSRMVEAPVKLPPGHVIPLLANSELAAMFVKEDIANLNDVYRRR